MAYTSIKTHYCRDASEYLSSAFSWGSSPEGSGFWEAVYNRLRAVSNGNNPTEPCIKIALDDKERERLMATIVERDLEIESQAKTIVQLRKKLLVSDFCNMGR